MPAMPPLAPPSNTSQIQRQEIGGFEYRWRPTENRWVRGGPTSRIGRIFTEESAPSALAESGRGRELSETLGRQPTISEIFLGADEPSSITQLSGVPVGTSRTEEEDRARRTAFQESMAAASRPGKSDWTAIVEALGNLGGDGGGFTPVRVQRDLFQLAETPEEQALLARELADIEARRAAGTEALGAGWAQLSQANAAAAEKARQQVMQYGDAAAAAWTDAANRARSLAAERAQAAGSAAGRQSINVSPTGGAADFIAFMESQAPAAGQFAQRTQETLASDLDWLASTATAQGQAYQGDLQRQANVMAFERAREHNRAVQDRIGEERMALADMEFRAASTNAELAQAAAKQTGQSASQFQGTLVAALLAGDAQGPGVLAGFLGLEPAQAQSLYDSAKSSPLGISLINQANKQ